MYVRIEFGQPKARYFAKYQQEDANVNGRNGLSYACFFAFVAVTLSLMKEERNESEVRSSGMFGYGPYSYRVLYKLFRSCGPFELRVEREVTVELELKWITIIYIKIPVKGFPVVVIL